jgi:G patch domain/KOW motif-containing protein
METATKEKDTTLPLPTKIGFSFAQTTTANRKKRDPEDSEKKDYVTSISGSKFHTLTGDKPSSPLVIPLELQGQTKKARKGSPCIATPTSDSIMGLPTQKTLDEIAAEELLREAKDEPLKPAEPRRILPILLQNQIEGIEHITDEEKRFKYDLESRPDEADPEAYDDVPVEEFGFAMLRGMGWEPGKPIGLNNKGLVEPIEFVPRAGFRLGLGATPQDIPIKKKKYIKPGESREPKIPMGLPVGPDGKVRHVKAISEKLVPLKQVLQEGNLVGIVSGPHDGLYARVVRAVQDDEVIVRLESSSEEVIVSKSDLTILDSSKLAESHPALSFITRAEKDDNETDEGTAKHKKGQAHRLESSKFVYDEDKTKMWVRPRIMVRVISKSFSNGRYYNKKVKVLDVTGDNECVVQLDDGNLVGGVKQRMLETVIPKPGGKVMVVEGPNRGMIGILLDRKKSGTNETAIVQFLGDLSISEFYLDDVAQYAGTIEEEAIDVAM